MLVGEVVYIRCVTPADVPVVAVSPGCCTVSYRGISWGLEGERVSAAGSSPAS